MLKGDVKLRLTIVIGHGSDWRSVAGDAERRRVGRGRPRPGQTAAVDGVQDGSRRLRRRKAAGSVRRQAKGAAHRQIRAETVSHRVRTLQRRLLAGLHSA